MNLQLTIKVGDKVGCTYAELMALKATLEALNTMNSAYMSLKQYRNGHIDGILPITWLNNSVVCNLSAGALRVLNSINLYGTTYDQDHC